MHKLGCSYFSLKSGKRAKWIFVVTFVLNASFGWCQVCLHVMMLLDLKSSFMRLGRALVCPLRTCCWDVLIYHRIRGVHLLYKDQSARLSLWISCLCGMLLLGWSPVCWNLSQFFLDLLHQLTKACGLFPVNSCYTGPVTIADQATEAAMCSIISNHFPHHAMYVLWTYLSNRVNFIISSDLLREIEFSVFLICENLLIYKKKNYDENWMPNQSCAYISLRHYMFITS